MKVVIFLLLLCMVLWDGYQMHKKKASRREVLTYTALSVLAVGLLIVSLYTEFTILQALGL